MINLLPPDLKDAYRFGRHNVALRRWVIASVVALIGVGVIATYGLLTLQQSNKHYSDQISQAQAQLQKENLAQTKKQSQDVSSSLKLAVKVLGGEVMFSKMIQQIGAVMPDGSVLTELDINKAFNGIDLTANATNYNAATQIQVNLTDPLNKIFSKVDIVSITCQTTPAKYPCSAQFRAQFNTKNQFLFINQGASS